MGDDNKVVIYSEIPLVESHHGISEGGSDVKLELDVTGDDSVDKLKPYPVYISSTTECANLAKEDINSSIDKLNPVLPNSATDSTDTAKGDPYAYIDRNGFTSEKFKIEIRGLPKHYGIGLKKLLNNKLKLGSNKIKPPQKRSNWVYVCFRSEKEREEALKVINGMKWKKNSTLTAAIAKPAPDPLVKRRNEAEEESKKRQKVDDHRTLEEKLKDSTVPLWRLSPDEQATHKTENIKKLLRNMIYDIERQNESLKPHFSEQRVNNGGVPLKMSPMVRSQCVDGYRNKCEFTIGINDDTKEKTVGMRLGSYATGSTSVGPVDNLPHVPQRMKQAVKVFEQFVRSSALDVFDPETYTGHWRQLTVRLGTNTDQLMLVVVLFTEAMNPPDTLALQQQLCDFFTTGDGKVLNVTSLYYHEFNKRQSSADQTTQLLLGESHITEVLCGLRFNISPLSFFQVNTAAAELLYDAVRSLARLSPWTTLLDVCCGTGSIGLSLAKDCGQVLGLEQVAQAVEDARHNASINNVTNCEFFCGTAEDILQSVLRRATFDDVVAVVDPPRAGLRKNAVLMLRRSSKVNKIVYLACDLKSASKNIVELARPASKTLVGAPFVPMAVTPVDMFPHTDHCEVVIYLERLGAVFTEALGQGFCVAPTPSHVQ